MYSLQAFEKCQLPLCTLVGPQSWCIALSSPCCGSHLHSAGKCEPVIEPEAWGSPWHKYQMNPFIDQTSRLVARCGTTSLHFSIHYLHVSTSLSMFECPVFHEFHSVTLPTSFCAVSLLKAKRWAMPVFLDALWTSSRFGLDIAAPHAENIRKLHTSRWDPQGTKSLLWARRLLNVFEQGVFLLRPAYFPSIYSAHPPKVPWRNNWVKPKQPKVLARTWSNCHLVRTNITSSQADAASLLSYLHRTYT